MDLEVRELPSGRYQSYEDEFDAVGMVRWRAYFGNQNVTLVPFVAVKLAGWNVNVPWKPTST
jgi:hypothetical protein